ncbi:MAG TPA: hypothetical protein VJN70_13160 [Gemmatimonadaceae bacterium]|nr:hypothetical protein [Gemmatimonadaceae bacterium]
MNEEMLVDVLVFAGLMATLFCTMKLILIAVDRRKRVPKESSVATIEEISRRLARMEQAMDTTAIEVERISEAQRFTTKLLVDRGHQNQSDVSRAKVITPH